MSRLFAGRHPSGTCHNEWSSTQRVLELQDAHTRQTCAQLIRGHVAAKNRRSHETSPRHDLRHVDGRGLSPAM
eukprot:scaffold705_cov402-Prasinococcus_capsulatus_cf.AAC.47